MFIVEEGHRESLLFSLGEVVLLEYAERSRSLSRIYRPCDRIPDIRVQRRPPVLNNELL